MQLDYFEEPALAFGRGKHVCPRRGIADYGVFDYEAVGRGDVVRVGAVGTGICLQKLASWVEQCRNRIAGPEGARQVRLFPSFPGIRADSGFHTNFMCGDHISRQIPQGDVTKALNVRGLADRVAYVVDLYHEHIAFLAENREVDVVVCVIPDQLYDVLYGDGGEEQEDALDDPQAGESPKGNEANFRRAVKARALHLGRPIQLARESTFDSTTLGQQDEATKAWNFWTALYYKSGPKVPWKIPRYAGSFSSSCAIGLAFYRTRDGAELQTSLAQLFDEMGNSVILRGTSVEIDKHDRTPRLSDQQAHDLILGALQEYRAALGSSPSRIVIHKSANFSDQEMEGIGAAATSCGTQYVDFVTVMGSDVHLYREGNYPPYRGTVLHLDEGRHVLYTRGSVWYYQTYPGLYIPQPIEYRPIRCDSSPTAIGKEILALTKLDWNNTQLDGKFPITLGCARRVGKILKYLGPDDVVPTRYAYYM